MRRARRAAREGGIAEGGMMHVHRATIRHDEVRDYDFADRALALRQRSGLTQRELAAHLGVNYKAIGAWEGGLSYPGAERLKQLIALYLARGTLQAGREEEEATALWESVRTTARRHTVPFDPYWFAALPRATGTAVLNTPTLAVVPQASAPLDAGALAGRPGVGPDWGEAPDVLVLRGRAHELATLERWVRQERCRLVLLLGAGGSGKTALAATLAHAVADAFPAIYWRSLRAALPPADWLAGAIAALSTGPAPLPEGVEARLGRMLALLRERRALLVLDHLESVLEPGVPEVRYRAGYEGYGEILQRLGTSAHQGCLLVTSREQPLRADHPAVRALRLPGLGVEASRALLARRGLAGDAAAWGALVARYGGNPLALQVAGETVSAVFGGDLAAFLAQDVAVFGEIRQLLDEQVARLSAPEHAVLPRLAAEQTALGVGALVRELRPVVGPVAAVEAVEALARRSLLAPGDGGALALPPVLLQYAGAQRVERGGAPGQAGHRRWVVQPGASGSTIVTWDVAWPRARAAALWAAPQGQPPAVMRRPVGVQTSGEFGRESRRRAAS